MPFGLLDIAILALAGGLGATLLFTGLRRETRTLQLKRRMATLNDTQKKEAPWQAGGRMRNLLPLLTVGAKDRQEITQSLQTIGRHDPAAAVAFAAWRLVATLLAAALAAYLLWRSGRLVGVNCIIPFIAACLVFVAAKLVLRRLVVARQRRIAREVPFALDIMLLMLESGVSLDQCIRYMAQMDGRAMPMIQQSLRALVADLQRGMGYDAALDRWADRLGTGSVRELAAIFKQSLLNGTELGPTLRSFVHEFADIRVATAREKIGKKNTQITVTMMIFLIPALFVALIGPAIDSIINMMAQLNR